MWPGIWAKKSAYFASYLALANLAIASGLRRNRCALTHARVGSVLSVARITGERATSVDLNRARLILSERVQQNYVCGRARCYRIASRTRLRKG